jgi:hypothetical protein
MILRDFRSALAGVLLILLSAPVRATTVADVEVKCPLCGFSSTHSVPGSTFIAGVTPDFRPRGVGVDMFIAGLVMCPSCGFTAHAGRFQDPAGLDQDKVRTALAQTKGPRLFLELDRAIAVERAWTNKPDTLAHLSLGAKWLADDTGEPLVIEQRLRAAIEAHTAALDAGQLSGDQRAQYTYLIGEFSRQLGDNVAAVQWFDKAEKMPADGLSLLIQQQRALAQMKQPDPVALVRSLADQPDAAKLAAIPSLRISTDPIVVAFLQDFCLNCPEDLREPAINALLDQKPLPQHLPIYLAGLRNSHFRTVQGSSRGVEILQAKEAAPIIVEVLQHRTDFAVYRLRAALAAVATEQQLDYLLTQDPRAGGGYETFNALLHTRSPRAIPQILKWLAGDTMYAVNEDADALSNAAAFGAELLDKLPDITQPLTENMPQCLFKINVLRQIRTPDAEQQLVGALKLRNGAEVYAALALAERGNSAGKPLLLANLQAVRNHGGESTDALKKVLNPADYDALYNTMQVEKAEQEKTNAERLAHYKATLADPNADAADKAAAERSISMMQRSEPMFMYAWLPILGATGNPKGRDLYLDAFNGPEPLFHAPAVEALARIYEPAIGDVMAERLTDANPSVVDAIIATFGKTNDKRHLDRLLAVVSQPTRVSTKLAWIKTMSSLAPDRAASMARAWINSPNAELADASRRTAGVQ